MKHRRRKQGGKGGTCPPEQVCWGAQGGTVLWQASDLLMSHFVKFDGSVALVYALHNLPFDFSLLQLKKSCITVQRVVEGGCGFTKIGHCLKIYVCTARTIMLSAPLTASIFLRLCEG